MILPKWAEKEAEMLAERYFDNPNENCGLDKYLERNASDELNELLKKSTKEYKDALARGEIIG